MQTEILLALFGVFATVALVSGATATWWFGRLAPEQRRLRTLKATAATGVVVAERSGSLLDQVDPRLAKLTKLVPKSPKDMSRLQRRLTKAGFPYVSAVIIFLVAQIALPVLFALVAVSALGVSTGWPLALMMGGLGYILPGFYISRRITQRKKAIRNGLPDALDLLTVCVEAGSGLDQAVMKATDELDLAHPALAAELKTVTTEIRAGKPRAEAFKNFAARTDIDDARSLVSVLTQTDRFGTSIAQALRTQSEVLRTKRRQNAEERAAKVGVKLVFPLALCLFPALYIVCFGPVVVQIYRAFLAPGAPGS